MFPAFLIAQQYYFPRVSSLFTDLKLQVFLLPITHKYNVFQFTKKKNKKQNKNKNKQTKDPTKQTDKKLSEVNMALFHLGLVNSVPRFGISTLGILLFCFGSTVTVLSCHVLAVLTAASSVFPKSGVRATKHPHSCSLCCLVSIFFLPSDHLSN